MKPNRLFVKRKRLKFLEMLDGKGLDKRGKMWTARRVNKLLQLTSDRKYLEVGVEHGQSFLNIEADFKVGVDPFFQFDVTPHQTPNCIFMNMDSDEAFPRLDSQGLTFDVIYLDGLHTFEQTYRDLLSALLILEPGGYILIDDVNPCDEFSYIPNFDLAIQERRKSRPEGYEPDFRWHGDVFKVLAMVHDYHVSLDYRTFWGSGNEQSILWESTSVPRTARFRDVHAISSMPYSMLEINRDILRPESENTIFEYLGNIDK